jgi:hypothetical protein
MERLSSTSTSKRLVIGSIVVCLGVVAVLLASQFGSPEPPAAKQVVASTTKAQVRKPWASFLPQEKRLDNVDVPELPDDVLERILKEDKKLGLFMDYYRTILPDEQKRDEYRKLLSDPAMIAAMAGDLTNPGTGHPKPEEYYRRLMQVDYFEAALTWKDNPQHEKLVEVTRDMIVKDNFLSDQDSARRQVLGGSKMELYHLLYEQDPQKAAEMVAQAKGTRMESLVNWMAEEELRRRAEEKDLQKKIDEESRSN